MRLAKYGIIVLFVTVGLVASGCGEKAATTEQDKSMRAALSASPATISEGDRKIMDAMKANATKNSNPGQAAAKAASRK